MPTAGVVGHGHAETAVQHQWCVHCKTMICLLPRGALGLATLSSVPSVLAMRCRPQATGRYGLSCSMQGYGHP